MKNNILKLTAVAMVLVSLFAGAHSVLAENESSNNNAIKIEAGLKVDASATLAVPAGYTVIPPKDTDRSNDQIVQLENLTIRKVSGSVPGIIYASRDLGGSCREFFDINGASGSRVYPCPLAPTVLYQISVQSDTILLLKNRTRANIGDFAVGDRINVFGFLDRGTSGLQALIMRNLDKPEADSRYVQLNNLTVITGPDSRTLPANFRAGRRGVEPCLSFSSVNSAAGVFAPCPVGVDVSTSAEELKSADAELYRPLAHYYNIRATANTRIMNSLRQPIGITEIQAGDKVNIYGRYIPGTRMVEAMIIRNMSIPRNTNDAAALVVTVSDKTIVCVTTPCGQVEGALVSLGILHPGDQKTTFVANAKTVNGQASFRGLKPGTYHVTVSASGYAESEQRIALRTGQIGGLEFSLRASTDKPGKAPSISSISPSRGEYGATVRLRGDFAASGNYVYIGGYNAGMNLKSDGNSLTFTIPEYVSPCANDPYDPAKRDLACIAIALQLPIGSHKVYVKNANGMSNSVEFRVNSSVSSN